MCLLQVSSMCLAACTCASVFWMIFWQTRSEHPHIRRNLKTVCVSAQIKQLSGYKAKLHQFWDMHCSLITHPTHPVTEQLIEAGGSCWLIESWSRWIPLENSWRSSQEGWCDEEWWSEFKTAIYLPIKWSELWFSKQDFYALCENVPSPCTLRLSAFSQTYQLLLLPLIIKCVMLYTFIVFICFYILHINEVSDITYMFEVQLSCIL